MKCRVGVTFYGHAQGRYRRDELPSILCRIQRKLVMWLWSHVCGCGGNTSSPTARNTAALGFTAVERAHNAAELIQFCLERTPLQDDLNKFTLRLIHHFSGCLRVTLPPARGASLQNTRGEGGGHIHINTLCTGFSPLPMKLVFVRNVIAYRTCAPYIFNYFPIFHIRSFFCIKCVDMWYAIHEFVNTVRKRTGNTVICLP